MTDSQRKRFDELKALVAWGVEKGYLSVRPDAQALNHPKLHGNERPSRAKPRIEIEG